MLCFTRRLQHRNGNLGYKPFDAHYKLACNYAQRVKVRATGPNCERETVNEGEENAAYKACRCFVARGLGSVRIH
jgi:hypothetical protein